MSVIFILKNNNNRKTRVHAVFSVNIKCREPNANFCHLEIDDALLTINAVDEQYKKGGNITHMLTLHAEVLKKKLPITT